MASCLGREVGFGSLTAASRQTFGRRVHLGGRTFKIGVRVDLLARDRRSIWFGGIRIAHRGERDPSYDEAPVSAVMRTPEVNLKVALGMGRGRDRVLTCDLIAKEYVAISRNYRS